MTTNPTDAQMKLDDVTQADRNVAADLLDELSSLLDHNGIGQVADLIRDGEYDEHDATTAFARHRQATEARAQGLVDALNGYKAAVAFVAADAWDGCSDCIDVLKAARCADTVESLTPDEIAANLKRIRLHFQPPAKHSQHGGERER